MINPEKNWKMNIHPASSREITKPKIGSDEEYSLESTEKSMNFCSERWDERVEDYFRGRMIFENDEDELLDHLLSCEHCSKHVSFLEEMYESLGKFDHLRSIKKA